jgi:hypothetical protein
MLVYLVTIWNILWPFANFAVIWYIFPPVLVRCTKKNLATLAVETVWLFVSREGF